MYLVEPPITGTWPFEDCPEVIELDGMVFNRSIRSQRYEGVLEQYRQNTVRDSAHLMVLDDRSYRIDHVDEYNPDLGSPLRHFLYDHPKGPSTLIVGAGAIGMIGAAITAARKKGKSHDGL